MDHYRCCEFYVPAFKLIIRLGREHTLVDSHGVFRKDGPQWDAMWVEEVQAGQRQYGTCVHAGNNPAVSPGLLVGQPLRCRLSLITVI